MKYTAKEHCNVVSRVYCDGVPIEYAIEADTDRGYVMFYEHGNSGGLIVEGGQISIGRVEGVVTVEMVNNENH